MRALPALLFVTACLSRPTGLTGGGGDGGTDGSSDSGVRHDWPPPGVTIDRTLARDVDGDGTVDLLASASDGVYVLPGGAQFGTSYATFVATPFSPLAFDVAALGGSAAPELAVLGVLGNTARVEIHAGTGGFGFASEGWHRDVTDIDPMANAGRGVWLLDSDGDGTGNVLVADETTLMVGEPAAFTALGIFEMPLVRAEGANSTYFSRPNNLFVVPGTGRADLVIEDYFRVSIFRGDGGDHYRAADRTDVDNGAMFSAAACADLDGDGVPEVIGGYGGFLEGVSVTAAKPLDYSGPLPNHGVVDSLVARFGRLDDDPGTRPDLVLMRHIAAAQPVTDTELVVVPNLVVDLGPTPGTLATTSQVITRVLPGVLSRSIEVGDFDHDGTDELRVIATDGTLQCFRVTAGALAPC